MSYVDTNKNPTGLQPGEFKLHKHMGNAQAWAMLTDSKNRVSTTVTIPDGLRVSKILPLLAKESHIPLSKFQTAIRETSQLGLPSWANGNPEGFLFPDTYDVVPGTTTALQILQDAGAPVQHRDQPIGLASAAHKAQFTEQQVITTEASLLEAEVGPKYYADVARAIDNRLQHRHDARARQHGRVRAPGTTLQPSRQAAHPVAVQHLPAHRPAAGPDRLAGRCRDRGGAAPGVAERQLLYFITVEQGGPDQVHQQLRASSLTWAGTRRRHGRVLSATPGTGRPCSAPPIAALRCRRALHTRGLPELGLTGWTYEAIECDEAGLPGLLQLARAGLGGPVADDAAQAGGAAAA